MLFYSICNSIRHLDVMAKTAEFTVGADDISLRLDQLIALRVAALSRRKARLVLELGGVFVDGRRIKVASRKLRVGQTVRVHYGGALERADKRLGAAARRKDDTRLPDFEVVFEDEEVVVVNKPVGLLTAPTPESDRGNLADLLARRDVHRHVPVWVVHRLDLPTSGLLVVAKTQAANHSLSEQFRVHSAGRQYMAVLHGALAGDMTVDAAVGGKAARSHFTVRERIGVHATVATVTLETGRTHQIRLHASLRGHPVVGDREHGDAALDRALQPSRMALHASELAFTHPTTGARKQFRCTSDELELWIETLRQKDSIQ